MPASRRRPLRRLAPLLVLAVAAMAGVAAVLLFVDREHCDTAYGPYGDGTWPAGCWRPYSDASPFNRPLPAEPRLDPRSDALVARLNADGPPGNLVAGTHDTRADFGKPIYYARPDDPKVVVSCTRPWGRCVLEGRRIRLPEGARPAAGSDGHLTVVDQTDGVEYDLWQARVADGRIEASWGGMTRIDGDGLGSDGVAARFGSLGGIIRAEELERGRIDHALFMTIPCGGRHQGRTSVAPALKDGAICKRRAGTALLMGARLQLQMSEGEIDRLAAPRWKKAILRAMVRYGMIVGDTGGPAGWGLQAESDTTFVSQGEPARLEAFARKHGWLPHREEDLGRTVLVGRLAEGVDWSRLRVVDPCVSDGRCGT